MWKFLFGKKKKPSNILDEDFHEEFPSKKEIKSFTQDAVHELENRVSNFMANEHISEDSLYSFMKTNSVLRSSKNASLTANLSYEHEYKRFLIAISFEPSNSKDWKGLDEIVIPLGNQIFPQKTFVREGREGGYIRVYGRKNIIVVK